MSSGALSSAACAFFQRRPRAEQRFVMPLFGEEVLVRIDLPYGNIKQHFFEFVNIFALFSGNEYFGIRYFSAFVALIRRDDTRFSRRKRQDFLVLFRQIFAAVQHDDEHVRLVEHAARKAMPMFSTASDESRMPAVSLHSNFTPFMTSVPSTTSRVVPATSETIALS